MLVSHFAVAPEVTEAQSSPLVETRIELVAFATEALSLPTPMNKPLPQRSDQNQNRGSDVHIGFTLSANGLPQPQPPGSQALRKPESTEPPTIAEKRGDSGCWPGSGLGGGSRRKIMPFCFASLFARS